MPRRNPKNKIIRKTYQKPGQNKKRYPTKNAAEKAANDIKLLNPEVSLGVYQDIDLGWYLTSH